MELTERNLRMNLPEGSNGWRFDGPNHGLSHCMRAVDFIVELPEKYLFIEFKDPDHPAGRRKEKTEFLRKFLDGKIDEDLKYKYRDSFLYRWACDKTDKPINYLVLVAMETLTEADLLHRTDSLRKNLPMAIPPTAPWRRSVVANCAVFNIASWNRHFPDYLVSRVGEGTR
jgi:hypothetical protein